MAPAPTAARPRAAPIKVALAETLRLVEHAYRAAGLHGAR
jgi:hypothetical protein